MLTTEQLKFFSDYIERELGIVYSAENYFQLQNRLQELSGRLGFSSAIELWQKSQLGMDGNLKHQLLDIATNNETSFFRDPKVYAAISGKIVAEWLKTRQWNVRIWSAASSFGQEPYSLAMLMSEASELQPAFSWNLIATDISEKAIQRSQAGQYSQLEVERGLEAIRLGKYFQKDDDKTWSVKRELKSRIEFRKQNLVQSFAHLGKFDLILCRNVLIYQKVDAKKKILTRIQERLNPGGYLIMGAGESLLGLIDGFQQINTGGAVFYQMKDQALRKTG